MQQGLKALKNRSANHRCPPSSINSTDRREVDAADSGIAMGLDKRNCPTSREEGISHNWQGTTQEREINRHEELPQVTEVIRQLGPIFQHPQAITDQDFSPYHPRENGRSAEVEEGSASIVKEENAASESTPSLYHDTSSRDSTPLMRPFEQALIDAVASHVVDAWLNQQEATQRFRAVTCLREHGTGSRHSASGNNPNRQEDTLPQERPRRKTKRSRDSERDNDDDDDCNRHRKQNRCEPETLPEGPSTLLVACPYHKYDPRRYGARNMTEKEYRNCAIGFWTDVNRLK